MFINKLHEKSNSSKMSSYINLFLKTEITCIPKLLQNYLGNYYSNALCNGATWVFVLWCVLHLIFDKIIDVFLTKLRYKEYVRIRLKSCLWYLGFYGTALVYCGATLAQNEMELFNFKKMQVPASNNFPTQVILGHTLISTFYLHSSLWEGLMKRSLIRMFSYLFLFALLLSSYILRILEVSFTLTALIGIAQVAVEFTRCCFMLSNQDSLISKLIVGMLYFVTFAIYVTLYIIIIPLTFVVPYGLKIMSDYPNIMLLFIFINMVLWLITEIYQSILFKFVDHWFYHENVSKEEHLCSGSLLECSLFTPRDDVSYNLQILREEIKSRETKMMSMRKPKNKNMIIQTLKCMVAIKRKLNEKRLSDSSDSDDSEKSEDSDLRTSENTDEDTGELHSEQDEESDDEESESQESVIETKKVEIKKPEDKNVDFSKLDHSNESQKSVTETKKVKYKKPEDENVDFSKLDHSNETQKSVTEIKKVKFKKSENENVDFSKLDRSNESQKSVTEIKKVKFKDFENENVDISNTNSNDDKRNVKSIEASTTTSKESNEIKLDETKKPDDDHTESSKPDDKCRANASTNVNLLKESNILSNEPDQNKCDNTKEPYENIDLKKPNNCNSNDKCNINVKSLEESNVKSEEPSGSKCDSTKESEGDTDVKSIEESNVKVKRDLDKGNKSNQVSEKSFSSVSECNTITKLQKLQLKDDVSAQTVDNKTDVKSEEVKEPDAASTSRFTNTE